MKADKIQKIELPNHSAVQTLDIRPDDREFVIGQWPSKGKSSNLSRWSLPEVKLISNIGAETEETILLARYSPDQKTITFIDTSMQLQFYSIHTNKIMRAPFRHKYVQWCSYAKRANRLAIGGSTLQVWDADAQEIVWSLPHQKPLTDREEPPATAALSPDGKRIAVVGAKKGIIQIFDLENNQVEQELSPAPDNAHWILYDPKEVYLAAIDWYSKGSYLWDLRTGKPLYPEFFGPEIDGYWCMDFHPESAFLAIGMLTGYIDIIDLKTGEFSNIEAVHEDRVWDLKYTQSGDYLLSGGEDGKICLWNLKQ